MYGLTVFSSGSGPERFRRMAELAARAEEAGFDAVWTGELYNRSATVPLAVLSQATSRVRLGTNIAYGVGRTPLVWAAEARDLDELSGGRLTLGLGNGTPRMMADWHGVSGEAPAARMEELVTVLRKLWRLHEGPVEHEGRFYRVRLRPTSDTPPPVQEYLPIWTAGVNPRMIRAAGRVADGLVGHPMFTPAYLDEVVRPGLAAGLADSGREPGDVKLMGILMCAVDADADAARRRLAFAVAQYAASRVYDRLFALHGWSAAQAKIREAARTGDGDAMTAAVPDEALDAVGVACRPGELKERVAVHARDYDHLNLVSVPWGLKPDEAEEATVAIVAGMS
ncbi:LLM class flavin-dependent oxidoreductase [Amycolatopsis acidiphila]|uniref:LLM class flavin-dependent oxidoreductase n=1 Tax=Amycolatopsis acidiphila TaxID=715473 RepID=A0A558AM25_9PSEU|nr:LLM class flavin-dependent oxidoreductase [Amycolatopsis acidiphila]TVT25313.1 LLM class flavin-dependent oxidoreductase [Amycolatopsis acidiphila]UIJ62438.1 LLM class flavin-dependent oxidoreductase [Amycolatopsis acidiphila]GHG83695.1 luciferase-like protein [Amycolatopsis acidiphila]